jgi:outer membrane lipoprotein-sorting protein/peroxiredoxin
MGKANRSPVKAGALFAAALAILLGAAAGPAFADARSESLIRQARRAAAGARTLEADLLVTQTAGRKAHRFTGQVRLMKPNYARIRLTGFPGGDQTVISDGTTLYRVNESRKEYSEAPSPPGGQGLYGIGGAAAPEAAFFAPERIAAGGTHTYAGTKTIEGKPYHVVEIAANQPPRSRRLYFGASGLPEGAELIFAAGDKPRTQMLWLKNVRLDVPMKAEEFRFTPPAGYKAPAAGPAGGAPPSEAASAPAFDLPRAGGGQVRLSELLKGRKALLLNFWFHDCEPCRVELPRLQKLYEELGPKGLEVAAINHGDPEPLVRDFARQHGVKFRLALGGKSETSVVGKAYRVEAYPTNYLIGADGKIAWHGTGFDEPEVRAALAKLGVR